MVDAWPLQWPAGKPRTPRHKVERSRFEPGSRPAEVRAITEEIRRLGGRNVIVWSCWENPPALRVGEDG